MKDNSHIYLVYLELIIRAPGSTSHLKKASEQDFEMRSWRLGVHGHHITAITRPLDTPPHHEKNRSHCDRHSPPNSWRRHLAIILGIASVELARVRTLPLFQAYIYPVAVGARVVVDGWMSSYLLSESECRKTGEFTVWLHRGLGNRHIWFSHPLQPDHQYFWISSVVPFG